MIINKYAIFLILWLVKTCASKANNQPVSKLLVQNSNVDDQLSRKSSKNLATFCMQNGAPVCEIVSRNKTQIKNQTQHPSAHQVSLAKDLNDDQVNSFLNETQFARLNNFHIDTFLQNFVFDHLKNNNKLKLSKQCFEQWHNLRENLFQSYRNSFLDRSKFWSQRVLDSFGRSKSGLLKMHGDFFWTGDFQECLYTSNKEWTGKYCVLKTGYHPKFDWYYPPMFKLGMCMPEKCSTDDVMKLVNKAYELLPNEIFQELNSTKKSIECKEEKGMNTAAKLTTAFFVAIIGLIVFATYYDLKSQNKKQDEAARVKKSDDESVSQNLETVKTTKSSEMILSFSAYTNCVKLFNTNSHPMDIEPLNAIRALSQCWIVASHSLSYMIPFTDNPQYFLGNKDDIKYPHEMIVGKIIEQGYFAVDTFFLISGLLTCFIGVGIFSKPGFGLTPLNVIKFYVYRYLRLMPPYLFVFLFSAVITPYIGQGPLYPVDGFEPNRCRTAWWTNVLMINNLKITDEKCFHQSWFLACDMQINLLAPFLLFLLTIRFKNVNVGIIATFGLLISNIVTVFRLATPKDMHFFYYHENIYIKPWTRIGPYLIGILLGYILYHMKTNKRFLLTSQVNFLMTICLVTMTLLVLGPSYIPERFQNGDVKKLLMTVYESIFKIVWASCLAFIIYACMISRGGIVGKIFSWPVWKPLSKMSYSTFLVHTAVINWIVYQQSTMIQTNKSMAFWMILGNLFMSHVVGLFAYIMFEAPLSRLQRIFLK